MRPPASPDAGTDPFLPWRRPGTGDGTERLVVDVSPSTDAHAALLLALHRYSGQPSLPVERVPSGGGPVHVGDGTTVAQFRAAVHDVLTAGTTPSGRPAVRFVDDGPEASHVPGALTVAGRDDGTLELCWGAGELPTWLVRGIAACIGHCLEQLVDPSSQSSLVADLAVQDPEQERAVLALGAGRAAAVGGPEAVGAAFAEQAARTPDAVAVTCDDRDVTYADLAARSGRLSAGLRAAGVRRGDAVGLLLGRSERTVAMMLAVLEVGAAYVPLATDVPDERLEFVVRDCGLRVVVVEDGDDRRDACGGAAFLPLSDLDGTPRASGEPSVSPVAAAAPVDPAYVIYTSGSTGRPKGVLVPHVNVVRLVSALRGDLDLGPADVWSWFHSSAFDFSVWEIWGCLLTGGRLVVVPEHVRTSPDDVATLLAQERVTVLSQTPSSFVHLLGSDLATLRVVVLGGEPVDTVALLPWFDRHGEDRCRVVNMFGITETTVHVTSRVITRELAEAGSRSVGRPIAGWSVRVVDGRNRVLPVGAVGEVVVGGAGVALGYLNRPELTAERFVTDPDTGERLYRSGDRGCLRPDGELEHLGRIDEQVKLRGHRIELGEVRTALLRDPRVTSAAVVVHRAVRDDRDTDRLDAYVVLAEGTADGLLEGCAAWLPPYMVPTTVTVLPRLPLTPNGKLDVAALRPTPAGGHAADDASDHASEHASEPASELERLVLSRWRSTLGTDAGLDDDFFRSGGNSLLAARTVRTIRELGVADLELRDLYLHPTPRRLAARLAGARPPTREGRDS